jgi:hypothetical protein
LNLRTRSRLFFGILALLACWPFGHNLLVNRFLINPWELGGFAMYVQPNLPIEVHLYFSSGKPISEDLLNRRILEALERYRENAQTLGLLASTDELARALRESGLAPEELGIELRRRMIASDGHLNWRTGKRRLSTP